MKPSSVSCNILLVGMVYPTDQQYHRDKARIKKLELLGYNVYSLDDKRQIDFNTEPGKHCCSDLTNLSLLRQSLLETWRNQFKFDYIILDYFSCPEESVQTYWRKAFFDETLPFFLREGFLNRTIGEIWLPNKRDVAEYMKACSEKIHALYRCEYVNDLDRNPLYKATEMAEEDLQRFEDRRSNQTELRSLYEFSTFPFLMLQKRPEVYLPIFLHIWRTAEDDEEDDDDDDEDEDEDEDEEGKGEDENRLMQPTLTVRSSIFWLVFGTKNDSKLWKLIVSFLFNEDELKSNPYAAKTVETFRWKYYYVA